MDSWIICFVSSHVQHHRQWCDKTISFQSPSIGLTCSWGADNGHRKHQNHKVTSHNRSMRGIEYWIVIGRHINLMNPACYTCYLKIDYSFQMMPLTFTMKSTGYKDLICTFLTSKEIQPNAIQLKTDARPSIQGLSHSRTRHSRTRHSRTQSQQDSSRQDSSQQDSSRQDSVRGGRLVLTSHGERR